MCTNVHTENPSKKYILFDFRFQEKTRKKNTQIKLLKLTAYKKIPFDQYP